MSNIKVVALSVASALATATPAFAASETQTGTTIVMIALGVVFLGSFAAIFGSLIAFTAKKDKASPEE